MPLAADVTVPTFEAPPAAAPPSLLWIASDAPPPRTQQWPVLTPLPPGWHEVSAVEARRIAASIPTVATWGGGLPILIEPASETAALSTPSGVTPRVAAPRPPRPPRTPRSPRSSRPARAPRPARPARAPRPPRLRRPPRPPRKPRPARKPRARRPRNWKTRYPPGICKGPGCTCWTPAGCAPESYKFVFGDFTKTDCYRGPCFSYEQCVSEKCQVHAACAINQILQFWARQYRAAVAYVVAAVPAPAQAALRTLAQRPSVILPPSEPVAPLPVPAALREARYGCPADRKWVISSIGLVCAVLEDPRPEATDEQLAAFGVGPLAGGGP